MVKKEALILFKTILFFLYLQLKLGGFWSCQKDKLKEV